MKQLPLLNEPKTLPPKPTEAELEATKHRFIVTSRSELRHWEPTEVPDEWNERSGWEDSRPMTIVSAGEATRSVVFLYTYRGTAVVRFGLAGRYTIRLGGKNAGIVNGTKGMWKLEDSALYACRRAERRRKKLEDEKRKERERKR